ncbi:MULTISPECIES: thiamine phosphate synthase [unclassified Brevundimonas]|uniref:thiamine phosphate synthase n=1 Tax=unclassified Brevundimonas TaxID=2622653 RepID=UPI0025BCBC5C|nr:MULTISPECIES: thiamine phosphate synthase [unclassified Brevundimonas]
MTLSEDARTLWQTATALARAAAAVSPPRRPLPPLLFFTDPTRTPRPWETAARLPAGAGVVFRHFGAADALETGLRLRAATREAGVRLLVGLDADLAERIGADGVHLPERALSAAYALSGRRPDWLLTGAAHSLEAAKTARDLDALVLSPVFRAGGVSAKKTALGIDGFKALAALAPCPAYALGGISAANAADLLEAGAYGIAGVDAVQTAFRS